MLATFDSGFMIQILAIAVPIAVGSIAFIWRLHERQDTKLAKTDSRTTVLETTVKEHEKELNKGDTRFEGVCTQIGTLQQSMAANETEVKGLAKGQTRIEGKVDKLLQRGN